VPFGDDYEMDMAIEAMLTRRHFSPDMLKARAAEFSIDRLVGRYLEVIASKEAYRCRT
jgi:hypothetical protein